MSSIEVLDLRKCFVDNLTGLEIAALDNLSFSCNPGLVYGLIGPNGSGKTTCLRVLSGVIRPTIGMVKVAGIDVVNDFDNVRHKVGYVSSTAQPYNHLTPKEFLLYCGGLARVKDLDKRVRVLIQQLRIEEFQDRLCGALSTGMKQRVVIAKALVHEPEVLLFDEPTVGLDILSRRDVLDLLVALKSAGRTILYSTHIPEEAERLCDHLMIMLKGQLIAKGSPCDILKKSGASNLEDALINLLKP